MPVILILLIRVTKPKNNNFIGILLINKRINKILNFFKFSSPALEQEHKHIFPDHHNNRSETIYLAHKLNNSPSKG